MGKQAERGPSLWAKLRFTSDKFHFMREEVANTAASWTAVLSCFSRLTMALQPPAVSRAIHQCQWLVLILLSRLYPRTLASQLRKVPMSSDPGTGTEASKPLTART